MALIEKHNDYVIREALPNEFEAVGQLMVTVYSQLEGFPSPIEQPKYYKNLREIASFSKQPKVKLLVAINSDKSVLGAVVYFGDMAYYGSGGIATQEKNASGFRLLAVDPKARGLGIGKSLSKACINLAKLEGNSNMVIHSTKAMQIAWSMYESMGFKRSKDLDFIQDDLPVYGFRLSL
ncbi:MAG: GNAT family N-acetyltransferase [Flavobacteriaceae bacterium]|nr:GNAT family N-acetyltransferase [Flavobacteriaceae bacterium]